MMITRFLNRFTRGFFFAFVLFTIGTFLFGIVALVNADITFPTLLNFSLANGVLFGFIGGLIDGFIGDKEDAE